MLQLHTITQETAVRSSSLSSTKVRVSTPEARISPIWVLHRFSVQIHGKSKHVLTFWDNSAKNSEKVLTLPLRSSLYKPKSKLNKCKFLVFLRYISTTDSTIRLNLTISRLISCEPQSKIHSTKTFFPANKSARYMFVILQSLHSWKMIQLPSAWIKNCQFIASIFTAQMVLTN